MEEVCLQQILYVIKTYDYLNNKNKLFLDLLLAVKKNTLYNKIQENI